MTRNEDNKSMNIDEDQWMKLALELARQGLGKTSPNPAVGAVIVKNGKVLASGWHQGCGKAHAERDALNQLSNLSDARGATIYITLEPCSTSGRTGACTERIIESGIRRVVYASRDPNPAHQGRADDLLRAAGIEVESGLLQEEGDRLIRGFSKAQREGLPWVMAKFGMSLDGRLSRPVGEGQWLTGEPAREEVHRLRAEVDAMLTSSATVRADDPALTVRNRSGELAPNQPQRFVLSRRAFEMGSFQIFQGSAPAVVLDGKDLRSSLQRVVRDYGCHTVMVEAGGVLLGALMEKGLIDEVFIFLAPLVTGGKHASIELPKELSCVVGHGALETVGSDLYWRATLYQDDKETTEN